MTRERCAESDADNPFEDTQLALVALEWLTDDVKGPGRTCWLPIGICWWSMKPTTWFGTKNTPAPNIQLVEHLARQIAGVLLLTATPEQLGLDSHFARLRLLDPDRFHDLAAFRAESAQLPTGGRSGAGTARPRQP